jgi:hypothetical protein
MFTDMKSNTSQIGNRDTETICAKSHKSSSIFIATVMDWILFIFLPPITKCQPERGSLHWTRR